MSKYIVKIEIPIDAENDDEAYTDYETIRHEVYHLDEKMDAYDMEFNPTYELQRINDDGQAIVITELDAKMSYAHIPHMDMDEFRKRLNETL